LDYDVNIINDTSLEITIHREQDLNIIFNHLSGHNIRVMSMRNKANRLEELFLNLIKPAEAT